MQKNRPSFRVWHKNDGQSTINNPMKKYQSLGNFCLLPTDHELHFWRREIKTNKHLYDLQSIIRMEYTINAKG